MTLLSDAAKIGQVILLRDDTSAGRIPAAGWEHEGLVWPVFGDYDHDRIARRVFGLSRDDLLKRGFVRYRLHDDERDWGEDNDLVARTCCLNSIRLFPAARLVRLLVKKGRVPESMPVHLMDHLGRPTCVVRAGQIGAFL